MFVSAITGHNKSAELMVRWWSFEPTFFSKSAGLNEEYILRDRTVQKTSIL